MEDKIYSILEKYGIDEPKASAITEDLLFLCAVSHQRGQLIDCVDHCYNVDNYEFRTTEDKVDNYLESINCG